MHRRVVLGALAAAALLAASARADLPWNYAVQVDASVDAVHSQITLHWPAPTPMSNDGYVPDETVYRKEVADLNDPDWGPGTGLPSGQLEFTDQVKPGVAYEYQVVRHYNHWGAEYYGYGYIRTGINVALAEDRGTVLLVVDQSLASQISGDVDQLVVDLNGDGWRVVRIEDYSNASTPADIQARVRNEAARPGANVQAVFLLGHLPIVLSGTATNPDGHFIRPMPADGFYGDLTGNWGAPTYDGQHWVYQPNTFPASPIAVGRVDFADLPSIYAVSPFGSEVALLRNYLAKDHAFRTARRIPARRALIGDAFGEYYWQGVDEPFSADGYRNFAPLVGDGNIVVVDNYHGNGAGAEDWIQQLANNTFLWAYGAGPGAESTDSLGGLGVSAAPASSTDLVAGNAKADFYMMFGSFIVDWSKTDNLLRSALAPADYGLAATWAGRPFLYFHAMGLGETIGYGMRVSETLSGSVYQTPVTVRPSGNRYDGGVYLALMGDPTLRLDPVPPVTNLTVDPSSNRASWLAPSGVAVQEYRVYWFNPSSGKFELETTVPSGTTSYAPMRTGRYMVRAVTLQNGSGTYFDASEGVFWISNATGPQTFPSVSPPPLPTPSTPGNITLPTVVGPKYTPDPDLPRVQFGIPIVN